MTALNSLPKGDGTVETALYGNDRRSTAMCLPSVCPINRPLMGSLQTFDSLEVPPHIGCHTSRAHVGGTIPGSADPRSDIGRVEVRGSGG